VTNPGDPRLRELLQRLRGNEGSDLHLSSGSPPILRVHGSLQHLSSAALTDEDIERALRSVLTEEQLARLREDRELDFAFHLPELGRFRGNAFVQHRGLSVALRGVAMRIPTQAELGLPGIVEEFALMRRGLVLVTGPAGAGKSTTMAAMVDIVNRRRSDHVITIEDPIEFVHQNARSLVQQREVGVHTHSFAAALRSALREDPNVIQVGEMRDPETIAIALTAAETGHLVIGTLHTSSSHQAIERILDSFPAEQQGQVRSMLAMSLRGVIAQQLLRRRGRPGRVLAYEILINTPAVATLIREGKTFQIPGVLQTSRRQGMVLMEQRLAELVAAGEVDRDEAAQHMKST
jgi:twitching motility protein PilT